METDSQQSSPARCSAAPPRSASLESGWHFQLKHLFGLTTIAAIAAALAARWGVGTLLTSAGLLIAWLNVCGAFRGIQKGRRQSRLLWVAWGTFLLSLALPSLIVFGPVFGYGAAWFALTAPLEALHRDSFWRHIVWYLTIDVANALAALLPVVIWRLRQGRGEWLGAALAVAMVATWFPCWDTPMLVGYFVWCASFLIALVAFPISMRTLAAMGAMALLLIVSLKVIR